MRICLIQPGFRKRDLDYQEGAVVKYAKSVFNGFSRIKLGGGHKLPPMSLMQIAALTSQNHAVSILDEEIEVINFEMKVDLVGITMLTRNACRGYEIADRFKEGVSRSSLAGCMLRLFLRGYPACRCGCHRRSGRGLAPAPGRCRRGYTKAFLPRQESLQNAKHADTTQGFSQ